MSLRTARATVSIAAALVSATAITWTHVARAEESQSYRLTNGGLDHGQHAPGDSASFHLNGGTTWTEKTGLTSNTYQLVSDPSSAASMSASSVGSGGGQGGGGGGGGGYSQIAAPSTGVPPALAASSIQSLPVREPAESLRLQRRQPTGPVRPQIQKYSPPVRPKIERRNMRRRATPVTPPEVQALPRPRAPSRQRTASLPCVHTNTLLCLTVAEGGIAVRLGAIYRFNAAFESIPAFGRSAALRSALAAVRPGSIAVSALVPPFLFRKKRRRRSDDVQGGEMPSSTC